MAIKLDISTTSVVVYCTDCGHWRAFAWTIAEGHERALDHEQRVHPGDRQALDARAKYITRHADDSWNVQPHAAASSAWESSTDWD